MPVRITKPVTLNQIATAAGVSTESMGSVAGSLVGSLIAGVYPPASTRANHSMSEYLYSWSGVEDQRITAAGSEFLISNHGSNVVISADGNTMAEASYLDNNRLGAIRIWVWTGSVWSQQARLVPPYTADQFAEGSIPSHTGWGINLSISSAGNTLMVGGQYDVGTSDVLRIYTRSGTSWSLSTTITMPTGVSLGETNTTMTADGQLIFVGDNEQIRVWARSGDNWSQWSPWAAGTYTGWAGISASADGQYVAVVQYSGSENSVINLYSRSGNTWVLHSTITPVAVRYSDPGAICLDGAGTVLVAHTRNTGGARYLSFYTRSGTTWTERQNTLYGTTTSPYVYYAVSRIVMNSSGTRVAVGGDRRVSVWSSSDLASWTNVTTFTNADTSASSGDAIAISGDGLRLVIGEPVASSADRRGSTLVYHVDTAFNVLEGNRLTGTGDVTNGAGIGNAVAVTADGSRMFTISAGFSRVVVFDKNPAGQWVQSSEILQPSGTIGISVWGTTIDVSADGRTVVVGSSNDNGDIGAVWVFMQDESGVWSASQKLVGTGYIGAAQFGRKVAINAAGNTLVVGGSEDNYGVGAVWVFTRSGTTWSQQGSRLVPNDWTTDPGASASFWSVPHVGRSVAISADGNTIAVGAPYNSLYSGFTYDDGGVTKYIYRQVGAVWVFTRSGSTWAQQGSKIVGTGYTESNAAVNWEGNIYQGWSISLSADGNTLAVGAVGDGQNIDGWFLNPQREGAVWVFTRSGSTWTQQGGKLAITGAISNLGLGSSVSLSASGNVLAVGGNIYKVGWFLNPRGQGAAAVYTRESGAWTNQTGILQGSNVTSIFWLDGGDAGFGTDVKVSASGRAILFGGPGNDSGAIWNYT